ncbi:MAG: lipopolysaccharide biosynthesis protein RfbH [Lentisphaerae bacterium]|nr:lipopolysaccharide biosynthesis protein RfbH [Lentisphaerota bacterium]
MDKVNQAERIREEILALTARYYACVHDKSSEKFVPGESRVNYAGRCFDEKEMINLVDSSLEFWLTSGRYSREFEERFANMLGVKKCLLVNSGSSANLLAFMSLTAPELGERQIKRGDEVITVAAGFPTTVSPILQYGAVPVFVDIEPDTVNIDPELLEQALSCRTKAVMVAHTLGNPFDLEKVGAFCKKHNLWLVEDNCDALGSRYKGRFTGTFGDFGTSSFYPPHHLTMGEGGAVYTSDPLLAKIALSYRDWGRDCWCQSGVDNTCKCRFTKQFGSLPKGYDHKYVYSHFGYNLKATDMQAAVGCAQLDKLEGFSELRKRNFEFLRSKLAEVPFLKIMARLPESDPAWFGFLMTLSEDAPFSRNELAEFLEKRNIQTRNLFSGNLTRHPCFESLVNERDYRIASSLEHTDAVMNRALWIGVYPGMTMEKLNYMAESILSFCRR